VRVLGTSLCNLPPFGGLTQILSYFFFLESRGQVR